jgi:hypothetical protein
MFFAPLCALTLLALFPVYAWANELYGARASISEATLDITETGFVTAEHQGYWWSPMSDGDPYAAPALLIIGLSVDNVEVFPEIRIHSLPSSAPGDPIAVYSQFQLPSGFHHVVFYGCSSFWDKTEGGPPNGYYWYEERYVTVP